MNNFKKIGIYKIYSRKLSPQSKYKFKQINYIYRLKEKIFVFTLLIYIFFFLSYKHFFYF